MISRLLLGILLISLKRRMKIGGRVVVRYIPTFVPSHT